jgi:glycosyltransferase 2 family protein
MSIPLLQKVVRPDDKIQPDSTSQLDFKPLMGPQKPRYTWLKFVLRLGCTLLLLAFFFKFKSFSGLSVLQKLQHLDDGVLLVVVIVGFIGIVLSSYQWQSLLRSECIHINLRRLINLYLIGIAFNHFLPTGMGGDVIKAYSVGKEGRNPGGSVSAVIMSRVTGFAGMLLVSVPALVIWHTMFALWVTITFVLACLGMCTALISIYFVVTLFPKCIKGKWAHYRLVTSLLNIGLTLRESLKHPRALCVATAYGFLFHVSAALNYYAFAMLLHMQIPLPFYLVAVPLVSLISFVPTTINGYGLRENAFIQIFLTMHVDKATAATLILLMDVQGIFFALIGGSMYLLTHEKKNSQKMTTQGYPV